MTTIITLPIPQHGKILVSAGDRITPKTILAKFSETLQLETMHLSQLLSIPKAKISSYLLKKIGEKIEAGETIAQKKGIFSSSVVKSPIAGSLHSLDLSNGTVSLVKYRKEVKEDFFSPVVGKVVTVGKSTLEIETENPVFKAIKGEGKNAFGSLVNLVGEDLGILDIHADLEKAVVLAKSVKEATFIKFSVIGARGAILLKTKGEMTLPWVQVEESVFEKLVHFNGKKVWLRPEEKQIVILD